MSHFMQYHWYIRINWKVFIGLFLAKTIIDLLLKIFSKHKTNFENEKWNIPIYSFYLKCTILNISLAVMSFVTWYKVKLLTTNSYLKYIVYRMVFGVMRGRSNNKDLSILIVFYSERQEDTEIHQFYQLWLEWIAFLKPFNSLSTHFIESINSKLAITIF